MKHTDPDAVPMNSHAALQVALEALEDLAAPCVDRYPSSNETARRALERIKVMAGTGNPEGASKQPTASPCSATLCPHGTPNGHGCHQCDSRYVERRITELELGLFAETDMRKDAEALLLDARRTAMAACPEDECECGVCETARVIDEYFAQDAGQESASVDPSEPTKNPVAPGPADSTPTVSPQPTRSRSAVGPAEVQASTPGAAVGALPTDCLGYGTPGCPDGCTAQHSWDAETQTGCSDYHSATPPDCVECGADAAMGCYCEERDMVGAEDGQSVRVSPTQSNGLQPEPGQPGPRETAGSQPTVRVKPPGMGVDNAGVAAGVDGTCASAPATLEPIECRWCGKSACEHLPEPEPDVSEESNDGRVCAASNRGDSPGIDNGPGVGGVEVGKTADRVSEEELREWRADCIGWMEDHPEYEKIPLDELPQNTWVCRCYQLIAELRRARDCREAEHDAWKVQWDHNRELCATIAEQRERIEQLEAENKGYRDDLPKYGKRIEAREKDIERLMALETHLNGKVAKLTRERDEAKEEVERLRELLQHNGCDADETEPCAYVDDLRTQLTAAHARAEKYRAALEEIRYSVPPIVRSKKEYHSLVREMAMAALADEEQNQLGVTDE